MHRLKLCLSYVILFSYCCLLFLLFCCSPLCFHGSFKLHWLHFSIAKASRGRQRLAKRPLSLSVSLSLWGKCELIKGYDGLEDLEGVSERERETSGHNPCPIFLVDCCSFLIFLGSFSRWLGSTLPIPLGPVYKVLVNSIS